MSLIHLWQQLKLTSQLLLHVISCSFLLHQKDFHRLNCQRKSMLILCFFVCLTGNRSRGVYASAARNSSAMCTAMAPSATAVTTCRSSLVLTSPTAYTPGTLVSVVSPATM